MKVAVIDIGTLKVKFLISDVVKGQSQTIYQSNTLTCLGVRMHENNNKPHAQYLHQTIEELRHCKSVIATEKVDRIRIVSTHALREMGDTGVEIAALFKKKTGFNVEIISQEQEASLYYQAVLKDFKTDKDFTLADIGGGSVQILIGNKKELKKKFLLRTGAQYLHDHFSPRHTGKDFPTREEISAMQEYVMKELTPVPEGIKTPVVYGSSTIIDVFKKIGITMEHNKCSKSHPYKVKVGELENFLKKIIPIPYAKREQMYATGQKYYMWGIEKALLNIISLCQKVNSPYVIPSNANINDGLILSMVN